MAIFETLTLFLGPDLSAMCGRLSCVNAVPWSALSSLSSTFGLEDFSWPSSAYTIVDFAVFTTATASVTFFCSTASYATSWISLTSATTFSFGLLSASGVTQSLGSSFFFCAAAYSSSTKSGAHHSGGHVSNTIKIASSMAINGSLVHYCTRSFRAPMYMLRIFALKYEKLCRLLCTVGDRRGLLLIHIQMLTSMSTQKIFVLRIHFASLVAQSEAYFVASHKVQSMSRN